MADPIVYGPAASSYVWSARMGLEEKGVKHQLVDLPFGAHREPPHLARHPFAKVPAFEHNGFALYETQAILRYVDEAFPGVRLQPATPHARARMNQIIGIVDCYGWACLAGVILWNRMLAPRFGGTTDEAAVAAAVPRARTCIAEFDRLKGDAPFMAGSRLSIADLIAAPLLHYFAMVPEGQTIMAEHPRLSVWLRHMAERPAMVATRAAMG